MSEADRVEKLPRVLSGDGAGKLSAALRKKAVAW